MRLPDPPRNAPLLVGYSGGLDSTVLLHLLADDPRIRARGLRAIHVHHGLQPEADAWAAHCRDACAALDLPLQVVRVAIAPGDPLGPEGAARRARHAAFADALDAGTVLVLAHHRDDQAETVLQRLMRASGPDGLAGMRPLRRFAAGWLWRPLLDVAGDVLRAEALRRGLRWIEDPSNAALEADRNFLRHAVLPLLRQRWPAADAALARSAALSAQAAALLDAGDAAALDEALGPRRGDARGGGPSRHGARGPDGAPPGADRAEATGSLDLAFLRALPSARRARVLRRWLAQAGLPPLPASGVARIESDLLAARDDARAAYAWSDAVVRRWRGRLHAGRARAGLPRDWEHDWDGREPLRLPDDTRLHLDGAPGGFGEPLRVRARRGGERIRLPGRTHGHALKHVLQEAGIPPWERERLPLLFAADGALLAVSDRILAAAMQQRLAALGARLSHRAPGCGPESARGGD